MKKGKNYTAKQLDFLRAGYKTMAVRDLAPAFNAKFGTAKTRGQIRSTLKNHKITCGRQPRERKIPCRLYTEKQVRFLRDNYHGRSIAELTDLYNRRFGESKTRQQIKTFVHNRGITSGRTGRFEKGIVPWNKGKKGYIGANPTSFKKGNVPMTIKPLGAERVCSKDGFVLVKVAERNPYTGAPTRYKFKHVHAWEQANGPIPKGHVVAFRDGNKLNCALENLMLVTRAELLSMNLHNYGGTPDELKPSVLAIARIEAKAGIRTRPASRGRRKKEARPA